MSDLCTLMAMGDVRPRLAVLVAVLIAVAGLLTTAFLARPIGFQGAPDQLLYLTIARDLAETGRYTDGKLAPRPVEGDRPSGAMIPPFYPALVAAVMQIDGRPDATATCVSSGSADVYDCAARFPVLVLVQAAFVVATLLFVWLSARRFFADPRVGWLALVIAAFGCLDYGFYVRLAMTDMVSGAFFGGFCYVSLVAAQRRSYRLAFLAGVVLGLAALTRPSYLYLAYVIAVLLPIGLLVARVRASRNWLVTGGAVALVGVAAVVLPWVARNAAVVGVAAFTKGYGGFILAQRLAYDAMTVREYVAGWVYWLPNMGPTLAKAFWPAEAYRRLSWDAPDGFYLVGNNVVVPETLAAAGGAEHHVGYLVREMLLPNLGTYLSVTALLAWRGLWISKSFALLSAPCLFARLAMDLRARRFDFVLFTLPALFMWWFNAAVSVSISRYNLILVPSLSMAAALVLLACYDALSSRFRRPARL